MDKLDRNNTITIKINGNEKAYKDELKKSNIKDIQKVKNEGSHEKQEINHAVLETASASEKTDESFDWVLPSNEFKQTKEVEKEKEQTPSDSSIFAYTTSKKKKRKNGGELQHYIGAILVAVLIGTGFMYVVLKTITAKELPSSVVSQTENVNKDVPSSATQAKETNPLDIRVVQGGVFSNKEAAVLQQEEFIKKELPAVVLSQQDKHFVILFASHSIESAKSVSNMYKEKGVDSYWKEFSISNTNKKMTKEDSEVMNASIVLYNQLAGVATAKVLSDENIETEKIQNIKSLETKNEEISEVITPLNEAISLLSNSKETFEDSLEIQKKLLQFIILYNSYTTS